MDIGSWKNVLVVVAVIAIAVGIIGAVATLATDLVGTPVWINSLMNAQHGWLQDETTGAEFVGSMWGNLMPADHSPFEGNLLTVLTARGIAIIVLANIWLLITWLKKLLGDGS